MSRSVPEWVGSSPDAAIPQRVKLRVWARCEGKCALTGKTLMAGDAYDFDHIRPLILGGEHREANLQLVSRDAHRLKTRDDVKAKSKADRVRAKFLGVWPKSKRPLKGRGFEKTRA
jgi:5-methylcytosine-specific restriction protein A